MEDRKNPTSVRPGDEGVGDTNSMSPGGTPGGYSGDYSFRCGDVMSGCNFETRGRTEDEVRRNIEQHGREHHGLKDMGEDTWNKVKNYIRRKAA